MVVRGALYVSVMPRKRKELGKGAHRDEITHCLLPVVRLKRSPENWGTFISLGEGLAPAPSGAILMKFGVNFRHVNRHCWKGFRGQRSKFKFVPKALL